MRYLEKILTLIFDSLFLLPTTCGDFKTGESRENSCLRNPGLPSRGQESIKRNIFHYNTQLVALQNLSANQRSEKIVQDHKS